MNPTKLMTTLLALVFAATLCQAQNYIGQTKSRIINDLKKDVDFGIIQDASESEEFIMKYTNFNASIVKYFYFDDKGKCVKFTVINKNLAEYKGTVKDLNRKFKKKDKTIWIENGNNECQWRIDKKEKFFALIVTKLS